MTPKFSLLTRGYLDLLIPDVEINITAEHGAVQSLVPTGFDESDIIYVYGFRLQPDREHGFPHLSPSGYLKWRDEIARQIKEAGTTCVLDKDGFPHRGLEGNPPTVPLTIELVDKIAEEEFSRLVKYAKIELAKANRRVKKVRAEKLQAQKILDQWRNR